MKRGAAIKGGESKGVFGCEEKWKSEKAGEIERREEEWRGEEKIEGEVSSDGNGKEEIRWYESQIEEFWSLRIGANRAEENEEGKWRC